MGSALVDAKILHDHGWDELEARARQCVEALVSARKEMEPQMNTDKHR
jgi:hypothetical protein